VPEVGKRFTPTLLKVIPAAAALLEFAGHLQDQERRIKIMGLQ
jgi:hypothetical protein